MKPITTGVLSFGMSGQIFHSPFIKHHDGFELYAVVERSIKKAHLSYPAIKSYNTVAALIADSNIELVIINTPNETHFEFALKALQAKKNVLIEKPFTVTTKEAKALFKEAKEQACYILAYQNRRFDTDFISVKNVIQSGKLGKLVEVHLRFDRYRYAISTKKTKETNVPGSGLLYDLGPHLIDQAISLFGIPLQWRKNLGFFRPNTEVDDFSFIHLLYPENMQVCITTSKLVADAQPAFIIHGTKGTYIKNRVDVQERQLGEGMSPLDKLYGKERKNEHGLLTTISLKDEKQQEKIHAEKSSYMLIFDAVYNTIRNGEVYPVTENQILKQLEILEE